MVKLDIKRIVMRLCILFGSQEALLWLCLNLYAENAATLKDHPMKQLWLHPFEILIASNPAKKHTFSSSQLYLLQNRREACWTFNGFHCSQIQVNELCGTTEVQVSAGKSQPMYRLLEVCCAQPRDFAYTVKYHYLLFLENKGIFNNFYCKCVFRGCSCEDTKGCRSNPRTVPGFQKRSGCIKVSSQFLCYVLLCDGTVFTYYLSFKPSYPIFYVW